MQISFWLNVVLLYVIKVVIIWKRRLEVYQVQNMEDEVVVPIDQVR